MGPFAPAGLRSSHRPDATSAPAGGDRGRPVCDGRPPDAPHPRRRLTTNVLGVLTKTVVESCGPAEETASIWNAAPFTVA